MGQAYSLTKHKAAFRLQIFMLQLGRKTNCKAASYAIVPRRWVSHSESSRMVRRRQRKSIFVSLAAPRKRPDGQSPVQPRRNPAARADLPGRSPAGSTSLAAISPAAEAAAARWWANTRSLKAGPGPSGGVLAGCATAAGCARRPVRGRGQVCIGDLDLVRSVSS